jgi:hypothetical protein
MSEEKKLAVLVGGIVCAAAEAIRLAASRAVRLTAWRRAAHCATNLKLCGAKRFAQ